MNYDWTFISWVKKKTRLPIILKGLISHDDIFEAVKRGVDGTPKNAHITGSAVNAVNAIDDSMVELGDDFGFSEQRFDLPDFKTYSPSKGVDV